MERPNALAITLISVSIILAFILGFSLIYVSTNRVFTVASESMEPTLNVGDAILVQTGFSTDDYAVGYGTGDIIFFISPRTLDEYIVHRAVEKHEYGGLTYFITKGDNNPGVDNWNNGLGVPETSVIGKVTEVNSLPLLISTGVVTLGLLWITAIIIMIVAGIYFLVKKKQMKQHDVPKPPT